MENLNNKDIISENQTNRQPFEETPQKMNSNTKSYKGLKIINRIIFILSILCAIADAIFLGLFITSDNLGRAVMIITLFLVPIVSLCVGTISLILSILTVKKTKISKLTMIANIIFLIFEIISIILCFILI